MKTKHKLFHAMLKQQGFADEAKDSSSVFISTKRFDTTYRKYYSLTFSSNTDKNPNTLSVKCFGSESIREVIVGKILIDDVLKEIANSGIIRFIDRMAERLWALQQLLFNPN